MRVKSKSFLRIAFALCCVLLISTSCEKKEYYYSDTDIYTANFDVAQKHWLWDSSRGCYYYTYNDNLITPNVVNNGAVVGAVYIDGSYRKLPYTTYFIGNNGVRYAETINIEYNNGYVRFNVIALDEFQDTPDTYKPSAAKFRITTISYF